MTVCQEVFVLKEGVLLSSNQIFQSQPRQPFHFSIWPREAKTDQLFHLKWILMNFLMGNFIAYYLDSEASQEPTLLHVTVMIRI